MASNNAPGTPVYEDAPVRWFALAAVLWGIVGMLVGVIIAAQLTWPELNFGISFLSYGRLRPLHTNAVIFAFGGSVLFATAYHVVQHQQRKAAQGDSQHEHVAHQVGTEELLTCDHQAEQRCSRTQGTDDQRALAPAVQVRCELFHAVHGLCGVPFAGLAGVSEAFCAWPACRSFSSCSRSSAGTSLIVAFWLNCNARM